MSMDNKQTKQKLFYILFVLIFIFTLGTPSQAFTLTSKLDVSKTKPCKGLDIVFLVSYSSPTKFNDGVGLRLRSMETALNILGDNAIYLCPGFQHRIAVIGFGDRQDPESDWIEFVSPTNINPSLDLGDWPTQKSNLLQQIPDAQDLGRYSNFKDGLQKASDILANWRKEGFDPTKREQSVLIISDGDMCVYKKTGNGGDCDFREMGKIFQGILPIVSPIGKDLPANITITDF